MLQISWNFIALIKALLLRHLNRKMVLYLCTPKQTFKFPDLNSTSFYIDLEKVLNFLWMDRSSHDTLHPMYLYPIFQTLYSKHQLFWQVTELTRLSQLQKRELKFKYSYFLEHTFPKMMAFKVGFFGLLRQVNHRIGSLLIERRNIVLEVTTY